MPTGKIKLGTGLQSTLLSSQETTTHPNNPPTKDRPPGGTTPQHYPAGSTPSRPEFSLGSWRCTARSTHADRRHLPAPLSRGIQQTGRRIARRPLCPAPAGLATLPDWCCDSKPGLPVDRTNLDPTLGISHPPPRSEHSQFTRLGWFGFLGPCQPVCPVFPGAERKLRGCTSRRQIDLGSSASHRPRGTHRPHRYRIRTGTPTGTARHVAPTLTHARVVACPSRLRPLPGRRYLACCPRSDSSQSADARCSSLSCRSASSPSAAAPG
jgi:hypothetical protein